jgi:hypothetical protein
MDENKLRGILYQLQEQNRELLTMVMHLQVSNNQLKEQLNHDFYKVYEEIYDSKPQLHEAKEILKSKKFIMDEMDYINARTTEKIVTKFEENLAVMEENSDTILS